MEERECNATTVESGDTWHGIALNRVDKRVTLKVREIMPATVPLKGWGRITILHSHLMGHTKAIGRRDRVKELLRMETAGYAEEGILLETVLGTPAKEQEDFDHWTLGIITMGMDNKERSKRWRA